MTPSTPSTQTKVDAMGNFKVYNVKGDGSCYYRCVWRLAQLREDIAEALFVNDRKDEERGCEEIREYVALSLRFEKPARDYLKNLIEVFREVPDISSNYPLLEEIDFNLDFDTICTNIADKIENSKMMASSFEHEIIKKRLSEVSYDSACELHIIVLSQHEDLHSEALAEKWLEELAVIIPKITCVDIAIFINVDNIHYKYAKFEDSMIIKRRNLLSYIESVMNVSSESE